MPLLMLSDKHWLKLGAIFRQVGINDKTDLRLSAKSTSYHFRTGIQTCPERAEQNSLPA